MSPGCPRRLEPSKAAFLLQFGLYPRHLRLADAQLGGDIPDRDPGVGHLQNLLDFQVQDYRVEHVLALEGAQRILTTACIVGQQGFLTALKN